MEDENTKKSKLNARPTLGSEVLQSLFENGKSPLSVAFLRWKLWKKWSEYVGATMGSVSEPVGYYRGVLYVWVKNSSWMQQLVFMREPMKEAINKKLEMKYVHEIRLTLDRKAVPQDAQEAQELRDSLSNLMAASEEAP